MSVSCTHTNIQFECSPFAEVAGFERPDAAERLAATTKSGRLVPKSEYKAVEKDAHELAKTFPAPLVLPWDDLNLDPDGDSQSFRQWETEKLRNKINQKRKTIYVVAVPEIGDEVNFMKSWTAPNLKDSRNGSGSMVTELKPPEIQPIVDYLDAFYHGMPVKSFSTCLRFVPWTARRTPESNNGLPKYVGLAFGDQVTRIRVRPSRDGLFKAQLNLDDILDVALLILPKDAHSMVLLVDHDIYEGEDDDYCCGRAYGKSRVAVVQSARYNPLLDKQENIEYDHLWPMSHCKEYVDKLCAVEDVYPKNPGKSKGKVDSGAILEAMKAASGIHLPSTSNQLQALWFARLARTVSHELGHCMGIAHCNYYACNMQSTASMTEDGRQPPYLCPVCLTKISHGISVELKRGGDLRRQEYIRERYTKLRDFCEAWKHTALFAGFGAWLEYRLNSEP